MVSHQNRGLGAKCKTSAKSSEKMSAGEYWPKRRDGSTATCRTIKEEMSSIMLTPTTWKHLHHRCCDSCMPRSKAHFEATDAVASVGDAPNVHAKRSGELGLVRSERIAHDQGLT